MLRKQAALAAALKQGFISEVQPLALFIDQDDVRDSVEHLHAALPADQGWLHTFAIKANPTLPSLEVLGSAGVGFEAASIGELTQGLCSPSLQRRRSLRFPTCCKTFS